MKPSDYGVQIVGLMSFCQNFTSAGSNCPLGFISFEVNILTKEIRIVVIFSVKS